MLCCRKLSTTVNSAFVFSKLSDRTLLRLSGPDTLKLLQGVMTNDMRLLEPEHSNFSKGPSPVESTAPSRSLYSMMLNEQGRVLHEVLLYSLTSEERIDAYDILVDCDRTTAPDLLKSLVTYRMRRKVDITEVGDKYAVYAIHRTLSPPPKGTKTQGAPSLHDQPCTSAGAVRNFKILAKSLCFVVDPRVKELGWRTVVAANEPLTHSIEDRTSSDDYRSTRYVIGVPEGAVDCPPTKTLPLEYNIVDLNGISFSKGCYIGQELTARTQHTGVVRKRILPLVLSEAATDDSVKSGMKIVNEKGASIGQVRSCSGRVGLALLRVKESMELESLFIHEGQIPCYTYKPFWYGRADENALKLFEMAG